MSSDFYTKMTLQTKTENSDSHDMKARAKTFKAKKASGKAATASGRPNSYLSSWSITHCDSKGSLRAKEHTRSQRRWRTTLVFPVASKASKP